MQNVDRGGFLHLAPMKRISRIAFCVSVPVVMLGTAGKHHKISKKHGDGIALRGDLTRDDRPKPIGESRKGGNHKCIRN